MLDEMMTGSPAFDVNDIMSDKILNMHVSFPEYLSKSAADLLLNILERDIGKRIGGKEIGEHIFYDSIDWNKLYQKDIHPPSIMKFTGLIEI